MRISTSMIHTNALNAMMRAQSDLVKTEAEVSSGKKVTKPSDDPVAAVRIMQLQQQQASNTQYGDNISALKTRLSLSDQTLADVESALQQVSELAVQANNSTLSDSDKQSIATQLTELNKQLMNLANTKDASGEYLFSGFSTTTQPFARDSSGGVAYSGDQGTRNIQVGASQYVSDGNSGQEVFMSVPSGNGTFALGASVGNTGSGVIAGSVQDRSSWTGGNFTLTFTSATDWQVTDSSSTVVASGSNYKEGDAITFNGVSVNVTGTPAANDSFQIDDSSTQDVFATIDSLIAALQSSTDTTAQQAQYQNSLNAISTQLSQAENQVLNVRASVGARVSLLDTIDSTRQDTADQLATALSGLQDSDYTEAVSRYSQLYIAYQAAQQSYAKIAQLSLFDYL